MSSNGHKTFGLAPGTLVFTGKEKVDNPVVHHLQYNDDSIKETEYLNEIIHAKKNDLTVDWYDMRGIHDTDAIQKIGVDLQIHPLFLEDVVDIHQRPKFEEYPKGILFLLKSFSYNTNTHSIHPEQISIYFDNHTLISFQEDETDVFKNVRQRLQLKKGKIRGTQTDYLAFALADEVIDNYFLILEKVTDEIQILENNILEGPSENLKFSIHHLRKQIILFRKHISPLREAVSRFSKSDNEFIYDSTLIFLRDLNDHTIQILDMVDSQRDILNGLQDLYLSEISNRMNQIMKVLTIITTIFVPLSFLAGIYGMNFEFMPELKFKYGYFLLIIIMAVVVCSFLLWFKKNKWL